MIVVIVVTVVIVVIVTWFQGTDRPTMSVIEVSWTAKKAYSVVYCNFLPITLFHNFHNLSIPPVVLSSEALESVKPSVEWDLEVSIDIPTQSSCMP